MFIRDVFRGSPVWVFDPARRPGTPVFRRRLRVSRAAGSAVRGALSSGEWGPARRLYRVGEPLDPWISAPAEVAAEFAPSFGAPPAFPDFDEDSPGGGQPAGYAQAMIELSAWRSQVNTLPAGPALVATLQRRPAALSAVPAPQAAHLVRARAALEQTVDSIHGPRPERFTAAQRVAEFTGADYPSTVGPIPAGPDASYAAALLDGIVARRRQMSALAAQEAADLAALEAHYPQVQQFLPTEIGLALHMSDSKAGRLLDQAHQLVHRLPATLRALAAGLISQDVADALVNATATTTAGVASRVEAAVLPTAGTRTYAEVYRAATYRVHKWDPEGAAERHRERVAERHVRTRSTGDGMADLVVHSTLQDIARIWEALTGLADGAATPDDRTFGARRVDALVDLCTDILENGGWTGCGPADDSSAADDASTTRSNSATGSTAGGSAPAGNDRPARRVGRRHGRRPQVQVIMPLDTLLGGDTPAELVGHGWITAEQAKLIAADAELTRLVCDPVTGLAVDVGHTRYRPPQHLAELIVARDRTCVMPGCRQPSWRCELDHVIQAKPDRVTGKPTRGPTDKKNLAPDCKHHHLTKDGGGGFTVRRTEDGSYDWTTPLGRKVTRPADRYLDPPDELFTAAARAEQAGVSTDWVGDLADDPPF